MPLPLDQLEFTMKNLTSIMFIRSKILIRENYKPSLISSETVTLKGKSAKPKPKAHGYRELQRSIKELRRHSYEAH